jgi:hypothetical protein
MTCRFVHTSQETHYVSATENNRLMLFKETVAVYCENHTEHTDTVRTSQETHYVSAAEHRQDRDRQWAHQTFDGREFEELFDCSSVSGRSMLGEQAPQEG